MSLCCCHSNKSYEDCCRPYHLGREAPTALALMRSRYSGYALGLVQYIIDTTHPSSPLYIKNLNAWKKDILTFSRETKFCKLLIIDFEELSPNKATVTFQAHLEQRGKEVVLKEKSTFLKEGTRWLYYSGEFS